MTTRTSRWIVLACIVLSAAIDAMGLRARSGSAHASGGAERPTSSPADSVRDVRVSIENFAFRPREVSVRVGQTITWVNHDDLPHTATSAGAAPVFDSKALDTDDKYSFTFTRPGTYKYYCKIHTHMTGTVIVK